MDNQGGRSGIGRRTGTQLGLVNPVSGPRPQSARIFYVAADSSDREAAAGLATTALILAIALDQLLTTSSAWWRLAETLMFLLFAYNLICVSRILIKRRRARRTNTSSR